MKLIDKMPYYLLLFIMAGWAVCLVDSWTFALLPSIVKELFATGFAAWFLSWVIAFFIVFTRLWIKRLREPI